MDREEEDLEARCPSCEKLTHYKGNSFFPFCDRACKSQDFIAWAQGQRVLSSSTHEFQDYELEQEAHRLGDF